MAVNHNRYVPLRGTLLVCLALMSARFAAGQLPTESQSNIAQTVQVDKAALSTPIFIENMGQFDPKVKFQVKIGSQAAWLTNEGIVFDATRQAGAEKVVAAALKPSDATNGQDALLPLALKRAKPESRTIERLVFSEDFVGASCCSKVEGKEPRPGIYNYFQGSDPKEWHVNVHSYSEVVYRDVWPGIDLRIYGNGSDLEQEFIVRPGGDLSRVRILYRGIEGLTVAKDGSLEVATAFGKLRETRPRIYQEIAGKRLTVDGRFKLTGESSYAFEVGAHKAQYALVIDPTLLYSTYLGGSNVDAAQGIAVDASGNAYVTGYTASADFPTTPGAYQSSTGRSQSTFITKLNATGSALVYSTYLNASYGSAIAVDSSGSAYVAGYQAGSDFPSTPNAYSRSCVGSGFLTVLNPTGSGLVYSSCFGTGAVVVHSMAIDAGGRAFIAGGNVNNQYPFIPTTPTAYQPSYPGGTTSGFVTVLDTTASGASSLVYSTYLGTVAPPSNTSGAAAIGIAVDGFGKIYVTGRSSGGFPVTSGSLQTSHSSSLYDAFIAKLDPSQSGSQSLIYSTYLGGPSGNGTDGNGGNAIAVDVSGNVYVTGFTYSASFPVTPGAFQTAASPGGIGTFVTKLNAGGSGLVYSTYLSVRPQEPYGGIAVDSLGNAYVVGPVNSATFPVTLDAFQSTYFKVCCNYSSAFLTKLNPTGSALIYSSFLGGTLNSDIPTSVAVDQAGDAYVAGQTSSGDFPITAGAFQTLMHGTGDAFITRFPLGATFRVLQILPGSGGNTGNVTATIFGSGFHVGASVKLSGGGQPDIVASSATVGPGALYLTATFNLTGAVAETRDLVVTNADGTVLTLPQSFTIVTGGAPNVHISKTATLAVPGRYVTYLITVANSGNLDSSTLPLVESLDPWFAFVSSSPAPTAIRQAPKAFPPGTGGTYDAFIEWDLPSVGAGASRVLTYTVALDPSYPVGMTVVGPVCIEIAGGVCELGKVACLSVAAVSCGEEPPACEDLVNACDASFAACLLGAGAICTALDSTTRGSVDPNDLAGPPGLGAAQWSSGQAPLSYVISFANESSTTVPAQQVVVTQPLDANLNLSTLSLSGIIIPNASSNVQAPIPPGSFNPAVGADEFTTNVDLRPTQSLLVNVNAVLNPATHTLMWTFTSLDPATGEPPVNPLVGFLPPGAVADVSFSITPTPGLITGTQIADQAMVVFDANPALSTTVWTNTIDNTAPISHVSTLTATSSCPAFRVSWSGSDVGSGLQGFTIFVSDNADPFTAWVSNTTAASADYVGMIGHTYSFYSIATDLTGNAEGAKTTAEASTSVAAAGPCGAPSLSGQLSNVAQSGTTVTATLTLTNTGFTAAQAVNINQITFRTLSGSGVVTLASPALPAVEGPLSIGASTAVPLTLNVVATVTRFSMTEGGNLQDSAGNTYSYSMAQTVIP